ncbi:MAG: tRNA dihydrouridine synthase DusB [Eggerthellaceae bacterium]|nr:tRNA dihydrouridine synthase DusB [Eggerthellaceae bacterium]
MYEFFRNHQVILGPMAGVGDEVFRYLCLEAGADLTYTEMISAQGLAYENERTFRLLDLAPNEKYVAVQLFGHVPDVLAREAARVEEELADRLAYIDINMGCPVRKIIKKGEGSALMKAPDTASDIVRSVSRAIDHPVTVKFRRGVLEGQECAVEFGLRMQEAGARAVAVHGRFAAQMYHGNADWGCIKRVKEALEIPVIGNGDIKNAHDAVSMVEQTSCDAVMVARAARGNPWIFTQIKAALRGEDVPLSLSANERIAMAKRHAHLLSEREGTHIVRMRKHAMWYMAGLPGASAVRRELDECDTVEDFDTVFGKLEEEIDARSL